MTVCAAALCEGPTIVGASDRMITAGDVQFEPYQVKVWWMNSSIAVMISGDSNLQTEILQEVYSDVSKRTREQPHNWWTVREVAFLYVDHYKRVRNRRSEDALLAPLGLDFETFINRQKEFAPNFVSELAADLLAFELPGVSAIIAGVDPTGAHLWLVSKSGRSVAATCHDSSGFVSIGMGRNHAQSQFMSAGHTRYKLFPETLMLTYMAKRRAEVAPGVGSGTDMFLIFNQGASTYVAEEIVKDLDKIYRASVNKERAATRRAVATVNQYMAVLGSTAPREQGSLPENGLTGDSQPEQGQAAPEP